MKEYLSKTNNYNFYSWHAFSGLGFLDASSEWMKSLEEIKKAKNITKRSRFSFQPLG